jgi:hypothetical protein
MSRPVYRLHPKLRALLRERGMTCAKLGALAGRTESTTIRTLANHPGAGRRSRARLIPHLTGGELQLLGWGNVAAFPVEHANGKAPMTKLQGPIMLS